MKITDTQRIEKYNESPESVKGKYASPALGKILRDTFEELIPDKNFKFFSLLIGDSILGFYKTGDLKVNLIEEFDLDLVTAEKILSRFENYLDADPTETILVKASGNENSLVTPIRTLESDMKKVHGYGAIAAANQAAAEQPLRTPANTSDTTKATPEAAIVEETEPPTYKSSQHDTLERKPLTGLPSYHERE